MKILLGELNENWGNRGFSKRQLEMSVYIGTVIILMVSEW